MCLIGSPRIYSYLQGLLPSQCNGRVPSAMGIETADPHYKCGIGDFKTLLLLACDK